MKAMILAGGRGSRLSEETHSKPKPLVEAGGKPLIWHIMQNYALFCYYASVLSKKITKKRTLLYYSLIFKNLSCKLFFKFFKNVIF